ncbi:MAG: hypothetical protein E5Y32_02440 [Mesorhizobium sp.]|nr:MAG: hypothetical protein E5Y32_02440 [Mesorhizobium sp.]
MRERQLLERALNVAKWRNVDLQHAVVTSAFGQWQRRLERPRLGAQQSFTRCAENDWNGSPQSAGKRVFSIEERLDQLPPDVAERLRAAIHTMRGLETGESDTAIIAYSENYWLSRSPVSRVTSAATIWWWLN